MKTATPAKRPPQGDNFATIHMSTKLIENRGGRVDVDSEGNILIRIPSDPVAHDQIIDAFMGNGFTRDESWRALDNATESRTWRVLQEINK